MTAILLAFGTIAIIIALGFVLQAAGPLGDTGQPALAGLCFYLLVPVLLFGAIAQMDRNLLFSPYLATIVGTGTGALVVGALVSLLVFRRRPGTAVVTGLSGAYPNGVNIGFPVATYVFGTVDYLAPFLIFELAVLIPGAVILLEVIHHGVANIRRAVRSLVRNPMLLACVAGLAWLATGWDLPEVVVGVIDIITPAGIAVILLNFGMSLRMSPPFRSGNVADVALGSGLKLLISPVLAFLFGTLFGVTGVDLFAVTLLGALPTAQNAFILAQRYGFGVSSVRDTVLVTTVMSPVLMLGVVALFPPG